jgi:hypothetical protein
MVGENRIARFGVFELDVNAAALRKNGVRVKLQDQPLQILSVLVWSKYSADLHWLMATVNLGRRL